MKCLHHVSLAEHCSECVRKYGACDRERWGDPCSVCDEAERHARGRMDDFDDSQTAIGAEGDE